MNKYETIKAAETLAELHNNRQSESIAETVKTYAEKLGADTLAETLAACVLSCWYDGRISSTTKDQARDNFPHFNACDEYFPNANGIHPAQLDQLAAYVFEHFNELKAEEPQTETATPAPVYYGQKGRDLVKYWRACNSYKLAERQGTPTAERVERATILYHKLIRYALADAHQWEYENTSERYANSKQVEIDRARLDKRRATLEKELSAYNLKLHNYGLYPSIIDGEGHQVITLYYLN